MINQKPRILFVEDEPHLAEIVRESLEGRGFQVIHYTTAARAMQYYGQERPHLLLLDVMLPDIDGFALAKEIRLTDKGTPILFLTAKALPRDVVVGFESGGNDYLKKPFSLEELIVRIRVLLSTDRLLSDQDLPMVGPILIGRFRFNYSLAFLELDGKKKELTAREAQLLKFLSLNRNQVTERKALLMHVWGNDDFFTGRSMDVFITKLRKYLSADPAVRILNIRGIGYKLVD